VLYIISTPIGNLRDITLRALDTLKEMDFIFCEDTRVTQKLLTAYSIRKRLLVYNDQSTSQDREKIIGLLEEGKSIGLVSDAGTPLISDPGFKLINDLYGRNIEVDIIPGCSSVITGLTISGLPTDSFTFCGYLPAKQNQRQKFLADYKNYSTSLIMFETAPRLIKSLNDIYKILGDREMAVTRELTKMFQEVKRDKVSELIKFYQENGSPKGEIVLVISGSSKEKYSQEELEHTLRELLKTKSIKDAAAELAEMSNLSKKEIYNLGLKLK